MSSDPDLIPFEDLCPYCKHSTDAGERFDGEHYRCGHCGKRVFAYSASGLDGVSVMYVGCGENTPSSFTTGRQRTRARWRKQGRR